MPPFAVRRLLFVWLLLVGVLPPAASQTATTNSLRRALPHTPPDSTRVLLLLQLAYTYRSSKPESTMYLAQEAWQLARRVGFDKGRGRAKGMIGATLRERGELPKAFANQLIAYQISHQTSDLLGEAYSLNALGNIRFDLRQYRQALRYYQQSKVLYVRLHQTPWVVGAITNMGSCYEKLNVLDSALVLQSQATTLVAGIPTPRLASAALALRNMGTLQVRLGHYAVTFDYYRQGLRETYQTNDFRNRAISQYRMADLFYQRHQPDSSLHYARQALRTAQAVSFRLTAMEASDLLARLHQARHAPDSMAHYQALAATAKDSLFGPEKFHQLQLLAFSEQQRQVQQREEHELQTARYQRWGLLAALGFLLIIALLLAWVVRQQRRANQFLHERNVQTEAQRNALDRAFTELRATQAQLVAAEKWAFMGELSAGIAHELQNPLAFMQNFAEVSVALLDEDRAGAARPTGLEQKIMAGLKQNLREISQHGQRASAIIADMLAHARTGRSQREPTDLNALITENLRLADHNHLALDGPAAIALRTDFAPNLGLVPVVPQEMGRALLNLFTNALHAVRRRQQLGEPDYHPLVSVRTQRVDDAVEIRVRDNGTGMSEAVAAQVFQPFFTTKAASEGTGLGLSLAHDIVEGHQGTLMVETQEGEFTEFTVRVPA